MELRAIRDGFGEELVELGKRESRVVVLSGDLEDSTKAAGFKKEFPLRFFNLGISEQDMVGTAAGMAEAAAGVGRRRRGDHVSAVARGKR